MFFCFSFFFFVIACKLIFFSSLRIIFFTAENPKFSKENLNTSLLVNESLIQSHIFGTSRTSHLNLCLEKFGFQIYATDSFYVNNAFLQELNDNTPPPPHTHTHTYIHTHTHTDLHANIHMHTQPHKHIQNLVYDIYLDDAWVD